MEEEKVGSMEELMKVLIVDDEMPVRQEMAAYPWESYGCYLVGDAKNGKEALQLCSELKPDIVISDISMPVMSGLELTKELQKLYSNIQVIILTEYEDFEYMKTALRLNVIDYIVKFEMNEEMVAAVIKKARQKLQENGILRKSIDKEMRRKVTKYMMRLHTDRKADQEIKKELEKLLHSLNLLSKDRQRCIFLCTDIPVGYQAAVHDELSEYLEGDGFIKSWSYLFSNIYAIVLRDQYRETYRACLDKFCNNIMEYLSSLTEISKVFTVTYQRVRGIEEFVQCTTEYEVWNDTLFYQPSQKNIDSEELMEIRKYDDLVRQELKQIFDFIHTDPETFRMKLIKYARKERIESKGLRLFTVRWLKDYFQQTGEPHSDYLDANIHEISSIEDLADYVVQTFVSETKYRVEINKAIHIINEEYNTRLQLSDVAYRIGLSPQYFSRLFREETGKTYSDYLISVRIRRARELLKEGRFKVYEVAELVGIPNYRYFSALFKKETGYAPKQAGKGNGNV